MRRSWWTSQTADPLGSFHPASNDKRDVIDRTLTMAIRSDGGQNASIVRRRNWLNIMVGLEFFAESPLGPL